jgi:hypothetical protein
MAKYKQNTGNGNVKISGDLETTHTYTTIK